MKPFRGVAYCCALMVCAVFCFQACAQVMLAAGGIVSESSLSSKYYIQARSPERLSWVSDPADPSRRVLQIRLHREDGQVAGGLRAEIVPRGDAAANGPSTRWYGFEFYVPDEWVPIPPAVVVAQLHGNDHVYLAPPLSLQIQEGRLFLMTQYNTRGARSADPPKTEGSVRRYPWVAPLKKGKWYRWVVRTQWSSTPGEGELDVWIDDELILSERGRPNTYDTDGRPGSFNYAKAGLYAPAGIAELESISILTRGIFLGRGDVSYEAFVAGFSR